MTDRREDVRLHPGAHQQLVETAGAAIVVIGRDLTLLEFNHEAERIYGYSRDEVIGCDYIDTLLPPEAREGVTAEIRAILDEGKVTRGYENPVLHQDGSTRDMLWNSCGLENPDGSVNALIAVGVDITERRAAEQRVRELEAEQQRRERLAELGAVAARVVHDVANPMTSLLLRMDLLLAQVQGSSEPGVSALAGQIEELSSGLDHMQEVLASFKSFVKEQKLHLSTLDPTPLVQEVVAAWRVQALVRGVDVRATAPDAGLAVRADGPKLRRVLDNLVKNAIEAVPDGGHVFVAVEHGDGRVVLRVVDDGPGVPAGVDVFAPFVTTKDDGTGLGLAIAREVVRAHGGSLSQRANEPRGAVFEVCLPGA